MKAKRLLIVCLALVIVAALVSAVACNTHTHEYTKWGKDETHYWKVCPTDGEIGESTKAEHVFVDGKCECGAEQSAPHECGQVCHECGKCLDKECQEEACLEKCEGHPLDERSYFLVGNGKGSISASNWTLANESLTFSRVSGTNIYKLENIALVAGDVMKLGFNPTEWNVGDEIQYTFGGYFFATHSDVFVSTQAWNDNAEVAAEKDGIYNITLKTKGANTATTNRAPEQIVSFEFERISDIPPVMHTVTFKVGSVVFATEQVEDGHTVSAPSPAPIDEEGYQTFREWTYESGESYDFNTLVTGDLTLIARWGIYIDFDIDGATGTAPEGVWANTTTGIATLPDSTGFSKAGHTFGGWTDGTTTYQPGASQRGAFTASVTLKAVWNEVSTTTKYTMTYYSGVWNGNGISGTTPDPVEYSEGETVTLPASPWTRTSKVFDGWKVEYCTDTENNYWDTIPGYASMKVGDTFQMPGYNIRITALWANPPAATVTVTVTYHSNTEQNQSEQRTFTYGNLYNFDTSISFTAPAGKIFAGWSFTTNGDTLGSYISKTTYESHLVSNGSNYTLELYAIWASEPVIYELENYVGKWTSGSSTIYISTEGANPSEYIVGSIIINNQLTLLWQIDGGFAGANIDEEDIVIYVEDGNLTIGRVTYQASSKTALEDIEISEVAKKWQRVGSPTVWIEIAANKTVTMSNSNVSDIKLYIVDKYIVITYVGSNGYNYQYLLTKQGEQLTGYWTQVEAGPVDGYTYEPAESEQPGPGPVDPEEPDVPVPEAGAGESIFQGRTEVAVTGSDTKVIILYVIFNTSISGQQTGIRFVGTVGGEVFDVTVQATSSDAVWWEGSGNPITFYYNMPSITAHGNTISVKVLVFEDHIWLTTSDSESSKLPNGKLDLVESSGGPGTGGGDEESSSKTFTGSHSWTAGTGFLATEYTFTRFVVDMENMTIEVTYSVGGKEYIVTGKSLSSYSYVPGSYKFTLTGSVEMAIVISADGNTLSLYETVDDTLVGDFTKA